MTAELQRLAEEANIPALSLAVVERGKVSYRFATGPTVSTETPFNVGCLGKPVTAFAILLLEADGRLRLDDPACRYVPSHYLPRPAETARMVTIRHLLSHTAGIVRGSFRPYPRGDDEYAHELHESEFVHPSGAHYKFSNLGYFLCGAIIERVTGFAYRTFIEERIFHPLGMSSAAFDRPANVPPGFSRGEYYALVHRDDALQPAPCFPLPEAAGGFYGSAGDYARLVAAILARETAPRLHHTGSNSGYSALSLGDPDRAAVAFCNRANASPSLRRALNIVTHGALDENAAPALTSFAGDFAGQPHSLRIQPSGCGLAAEWNTSTFHLTRRGSKSFIAEDGPFREYLLRFSLREGRAHACSAGPHSFTIGSAPFGVEAPAPWRELIGCYRCQPYATAEIFVRRNGLYCLCGPLHETRLRPLAPDVYLQEGGLFEGERLLLRRSAGGNITGIEIAGMIFIRSETQ